MLVHVQTSSLAGKETHTDLMKQAPDSLSMLLRIDSSAVSSSASVSSHKTHNTKSTLKSTLLQIHPELHQQDRPFEIFQQYMFHLIKQTRTSVLRWNP